ncbi:unnamed protein product [marine sediment metagenome]|uniref:Uncharacterized protein n=1 Tax=marine sediment metagenome TaxID=412755 RepID=X1T295_9ZZZZ
MLTPLALLFGELSHPSPLAWIAGLGYFLELEALIYKLPVVVQCPSKRNLSEAAAPILPS